MLSPVGSYLQISKPEPVNNYSVIVEKEVVSKAKVIQLSNDIEVPFSKDSTIFFHTGREIKFRESYLVGIDMVVGFKLANSP
jgi:hypothetical protein